MDKRSLRLASLFAYSPNYHGYCGLESANSGFRKCIMKGNCDDVPEELKNFITLYPYIVTISKVRKLELYDYKVIEAYWIGNDLLKDFPLSAYEILIEEFQKQGVPKWLTDDLSKRKPKKFIPHHLFQVLHVGVGQASGSVPFNIKSINECMIKYGKIKSLQEGYLVVDLLKLQIIRNKYVVRTVSEKVTINNALFFKPKVDSCICTHWGHIVKCLSQIEEKKLQFWTKEVLSIVQ